MALAHPAILALLALSLSPALAFGQAAKEDESEKVTNDRPDRPLQMPPASGEVKEAFDDFERFSRRGAWERALKALYTIPEDQALRFVDGADGFIIPVVRKRRELLAGLPPEGQAAYRLFYDDEARKLLGQADGASERATLERVVSAYFATAVGDDAADRLGDFYFESGRFDRAADCWLAVLRDRPDGDVPPGLLAVKAAVALARSGRRGELDALRRDLAERYANEEVTVGGRKATAAEHLRRLLGGGADIAEADSGPKLDLSGAVPADWQLRFADSVVAGMTPPERVQWETNGLSGAVPAAAVAGGKLFANYLGYVFALDLETGKLLWRSEPFHNLELPASQDQSRALDPARFSAVASEGHVWTLGRELKDPNQFAPFRLTCRRADAGDVVWQSTDLPDYAQLDLVGAPVLAGGSLFVAARPPMNVQQGPPREYLLAVRPRDGKLLWKTEVGTFRQAQQFFFPGMSDPSPQPRLAYHAGAVYVDTHAGVLARVDAETGEIDWGYGYQTEPVQGNRFFFFGMNQNSEPTTTASVPLRSGGALFVKGVKSDRLGALDPDRMKRLWDRPIARSARLIGADDRAVYLGGPELSALDRRTRELLWATRLPGGSASSKALVGPSGIWQLTPRGVFEVDPGSGRVRRIFRGDDTGSDGGDLHLTGRLLLAVTNRTISAYPVAPAPGPATPETRATDD